MAREILIVREGSNAKNPDELKCITRCTKDFEQLKGTLSDLDVEINKDTILVKNVSKLSRWDELHLINCRTKKGVEVIFAI